jgi:hypothetical protein
MENRFGMAVSQTLNNLLEQAFGNIFLQTSSPPDIVEQVTAGAKLYHE